MKNGNKYYKYYPFKIKDGFILKKTNKFFENLKFATFRSQRIAIAMGKTWYGKWKGYDEIDFPKISCKLCKKKFRKISSDQIYCSEICQKKYYKKYIQIKYNKNSIVDCKTCGEKIKRKTNESYCSDKCRKQKEKLRKAIYHKLNKELCREKKQKWRENNWIKYTEYNKKYHIKNKKEENIKRRIRYNKNKHKIYQKIKEYRNNNPEKYKAHILASNITIPKKHICVICNKRLAKDRHHENYFKPYEVWLCCNICHKEIDKQRRERLK